MAKKAKPVFIPGTNMQFASASAAAKALGVNAGNIYSVLAGRRKTAGGYPFGYTSNRMIYIPETGRAFSSVKAAARAVGANVDKVEHIVSSGVNKSVKGYHFVYQDASRVDISAGAVQAPAKKKSRSTKKQERIKKQRQKQQQRRDKQKQREELKSKDRNEFVKKQQRQEKIKKLGETYKSYENTKNALKKYIKTINQQIEEYMKVSPSYIYYHTATPAVMGLQMYTGYVYAADITLFDSSLSKFALPENLSKKEIEKLTKQMQLILQRLKIESTRKGSNFFDMNIAEQNRTMLAFEFFKTTGHEDDMDKYAYMIWDIIDVIERSNLYPEIGSDLIFTMVSDAMQGDVNPDTLDRFIQDLDGWMQRNGSEDELDEILSELDGTYKKKKGYSVFDDEDGWLT